MSAIVACNKGREQALKLAQNESVEYFHQVWRVFSTTFIFYYSHPIKLLISFITNSSKFYGVTNSLEGKV